MLVLTSATSMFNLLNGMFSVQQIDFNLFEVDKEILTWMQIDFCEVEEAADIEKYIKYPTMLSPESMVYALEKGWVPEDGNLFYLNQWQAAGLDRCRVGDCCKISDSEDYLFSMESMLYLAEHGFHALDFNLFSVLPKETIGLEFCTPGDYCDLNPAGYAGFPLFCVSKGGDEYTELYAYLESLEFEFQTEWARGNSQYPQELYSAYYTAQSDLYFLGEYMSGWGRVCDEIEERCVNSHTLPRFRNRRPDQSKSRQKWRRTGRDARRLSNR